ncbi:MAG: hypothetical protein LBF49_00300 [Puniceicoccales bacterium]|jgi:transcription elongation factor Elf1|nr:hypothetical protein [Puniceicoccales bacterium]
MFFFVILRENFKHRRVQAREIDDNLRNRIIQLILASMLNGETKALCPLCGKDEVSIEDVVWQDKKRSWVVRCPHCKLYAEMPREAWDKFLRTFNVNFFPLKS